jgi:hypothetical protein
MSQDYLVGLLRGATCAVSVLTLVYAVRDDAHGAFIALVALWTAYTFYRLRLPTDTSRWI